MRALVAIITAAVTLGLALLLFPELRGAGETVPIQVLELRPEDVNQKRWREHMEAQFPPLPLAPYEDSTLVRSTLALEILQRIYPPLRTPEQVWDADLHFRRPGNLDRTVNWRDHPNGKWRLQTNDNGQRMDFLPTLAQDALVVGIAGDSHFDGVCDNKDALAGLLQSGLALSDVITKRTHNLGPIEVVNTANGGHSFYEYLGAMEALLDADSDAGDTTDSRLDAMVVCIYGGNDFNEILKLGHYFGHTERPLGWGVDNERLVPWRKTHLPSLAQAVDGVIYFRNNPSEAQLALQLSLEISDELLRHAERRDVPLLFVYLPSALEAEPKVHLEKHAELLSSLDVTPADERALFDIGGDYLQGLRSRGAEVLDLRPILSENTRSTDGPLFWTKDLHLNLEGHLAVAEEVRTWLEGKLL